MNKVTLLIILLSLILNNNFINAQSKDGLVISDIVIKGTTGTQPLPEDVIYDGLKAEVVLWWDRTYPVVYVADTVKNATYLIMTANDKWTSTVPDFLKFNVNLPIELYIAYEKRFNRPTEAPFRAIWLSEKEGWKLLPDSIVYTDTYNADNPVNRAMELWLKKFPAGEITLGSNNWDTTGAGLYAFNPLQYVPIFKVDKNPSSTVDNRRIQNSYNLNITNYPNPFNPVTNIEYIVPEKNHVKLIIFNLKGEILQQLIDEEQPAGKYIVKWFAHSNLGNILASGTYFYQLQIGNQMINKKMLLLR